jgi:hypothetical protein
MLVRLCKHCCSGQALSITHSDSVSVALVIQHAIHMRHIVIYVFKAFFHIISLTARFFEKKVVEHKIVFWFSLQLSSQTFLVLRRTERDIKEVHWSPYTVRRLLCMSDFNKTWIFSTHFSKKPLKYKISWKSFQWEQSCSTRRDNQTEDEAHSRFSQFWERA